MSDPKQDEVPLPEPVEAGYIRDSIGRALPVFAFRKDQLIAYGNARARAATERAAQVARSHLSGGNDGVIHFIARAIEADAGIKGEKG
jgi:hypothetical protein